MPATDDGEDFFAAAMESLARGILRQGEVHLTVEPERVVLTAYQTRMIWPDLPALLREFELPSDGRVWIHTAC